MHQSFPGTQPAHRIHSENEPLPGSTGQGVDPSADNRSRDIVQDDPAAQQTSSTSIHHGTHSPSNIPSRTSIGTDDANRDARLGEAGFEERPGLSGDTPASDAIPHAKPGVGAKAIGKTEKIVGKVVRNPELEAKGSSRSQGDV